MTVDPVLSELREIRALLGDISGNLYHLLNLLDPDVSVIPVEKKDRENPKGHPDSREGVQGGRFPGVEGQMTTDDYPEAGTIKAGGKKYPPPAHSSSGTPGQ